MKKNKIKHYGLDLYTETLNNGMVVNIIPKDNVSNIYTTFSTYYGSFHNDFIPLGEKKFYSAPLGVAHFLEHKVFEQEDGSEPFAFYTSHGADANASTSFKKTTYLFSGAGFADENVEYLLDFVQSPYFTEENVEKEKGIIEQEIKMYDDIPYWRLYEKTLENSFINHPLKYPIAGTVETVRKITKEDLYKCYNTFYHPSNMFLTIVGNVDPKKVIETVKKNQKNKNYGELEKIALKEYKEPDKVNKEYEEIPFDIKIPKATLSYKINILDYDDNKLKNYLSIFFALKLGSTSELNEKLKSEGLISSPIEAEIIFADNHALAVLIFESNDYLKVINYVEEELKDIKIDANDLNRKKKVFKSSCIYRSDSIYSIASKINSNLISFGKVILDEYKLIDELNIDEFNDIFIKLNFDNKAIVVIKNV
jgi:Predicted Zn-dependent peptidases